MKEEEERSEEEILKAISKLLGIRGHLQSELHRIESMLAEDDPEMKVRAIYVYIL